MASGGSEHSMGDVTTYDCPNHKNGCPFAGQLNGLGEHLKRCAHAGQRPLPAEYNDEDKLDDVLRQLLIFSNRLDAMQRSMDEMKEKQERKWAEVDRRLASQPQLSLSLPSTTKFRNIVSEYYREKPNFTWLVSDVRGLLTGSVSELKSQAFDLSGYPFGAQAMLKLDATNQLLFCFSFKNLRNVKNVSVRPMPCVWWTLRDQSGSGRNVVRACYFPSACHFRFNNFYAFTLHVQNADLDAPSYNARDSVTMDVHVERPEVARSVHSRDGSVTWGVDEYRKRKWMAAEGLVECHLSPYFYVTSAGSRLQAAFWLNGYHGNAFGNHSNAFGNHGNGGLSVEIRVLTGQFECNARHAVTVTLYHPTLHARSVRKSARQDAGSQHFDVMRMGSDAEVEQLLCQDTLHYKVRVEQIE